MKIDKLREKRFSNFSYFGLLDSNFKVIWADEKLLFRRLSNGSKRLLVELQNNQNVTYNHIFVSDDKYYRARINWTNNNNYVCAISPEITEDELDKEKLLEYVDGISNSALDMYSYERMLEYYAEATKHELDRFHFECRKQRSLFGSIYSDCFNIRSVFESDLNFEFIPFHKYFLRTWDILQVATSKLRHSFSFNFDVTFPCIKIDYSKFELALYNLIKLVLIYPPEHCTPVITIEAIDTKHISVSTSFPLFANLELRKCELEIRAIKHLFRLMNGYFKIYVDAQGMLVAEGQIGVEFSVDENDIPVDRNLKYIGTPEVIEERSIKRDLYKRLYINDAHHRHLKFASEERELDDINDDEIRFAELLLSKVYFFEANNNSFDLNSGLDFLDSEDDFT